MPQGCAEPSLLQPWPEICLPVGPSPTSSTRKGRPGAQQGSSEDTRPVASPHKCHGTRGTSAQVSHSTETWEHEPTAELRREGKAGETNPVLSQIPASLGSEQHPLQPLA